MLSRRIIRTKVLQIIYAHYQSSDSSINQTEKQLFHSLEKTYDLYIYLLILFPELSKHAQGRIDLAKQKHIPTQEDLSPNVNFVENKIIQQIAENEKINKFLDGKGLSWVNYPEFVKNLFHIIGESEIYKDYMVLDSPTYDQDKKLVADIYKKIIIYHEPLYQNLEEQSIYWNDETDFVINMICRTTNGFKKEQGQFANLFPLFKNEDDRNFAKRLLRTAIINSDEYRELIKQYVRNWEVERIAFMDVLLMQLALAEVLSFPSIPTKVTYNEYIEISKFYSTQKSSVFLNGLLDQIINHLKKENKINKAGRGLIGEEN